MAQAVIGQRNQGGLEILPAEAGVEHAHEDAVDILGPDAGVVQRGGQNAGDEGFGIRLFGLAEMAVAPTDDLGAGHGGSS